ncbi:MAG: hypothetical protein AB1Z55_06445 [Acidimicrobiia bacterium]
MPVLTLRIIHDGLLAVVAPLGAALSVGTALVVDLDPAAPPLPGRRSVADVLAEGPTADDLAPVRRGIAVLPSGGADPGSVEDLVEHLARGWPFVVMRVGATVGRATVVAPVFGAPVAADVLQPTGLGPVPSSVDGVVLPRLGPRTARAVASGRSTGGRWVRAWRSVWAVAS